MARQQDLARRPRRSPLAGKIPRRLSRANTSACTIQPFDTPPRADQLQRIIEEIGSDEMLLFSTDYPHWHYDGNRALPPGLPSRLHQRILRDNPLATFPRLRESIP